MKKKPATTNEPNSRGQPVWVKTSAQNPFDSAVTAFMRRFLRGAIAEIHPVTRIALGERLGIARNRVARLLDTMDLVDFLEAYRAIRRQSGAPLPGGDLDTTIKCPRCESLLAVHSSDLMKSRENTKYSANCRQCLIIFRYSIGPLEPSNRPLESTSNTPLEPSNKPLESSSNTSLEEKNEPACAHVWHQNSPSAEKAWWWVCQLCGQEERVIDLDGLGCDHDWHNPGEGEDLGGIRACRKCLTIKQVVEYDVL